MMAKAPKQSGASGASAPPLSMTSASPRAMARKPSPMAMVPEAQLMPLVVLGPDRPNSIAMLQLAAPANTVSASDGIHGAEAAAHVVAVLLLGPRDAAERGAHHRADPVAVLPGRSSSASASASRVAAMLNCEKRSSRRARRSSM